MKQLLQNISTGELSIEEVPAPARDPASLLVATRFSVISPGTERSIVEIGRASLIGKARARPDLVKKVIESARTDGVRTAYDKVRGRLGEPNALGYSLCGVVLEACDGAPAAPGELVACGGTGYASHSEVVSVPRNLCARVPAGVAPEDAAYGTMAAVAMHGVRLLEGALGDVVAVIGLGVVGQLAMELVRAAGCVPLGLDPVAARVQLARDDGFFATADPADLELEAARLTERRGADGVLVTAASKDATPLTTAVQVARERAVVCIVGDVAISSPRAPLFEKELRLVVSRSYGPGRYDPGYEEGGVDYPASYVRWTEGRNLEESLRLMAAGQLRPSRLTTHTFDLAEGARAYKILDGDEPSLGILLQYPGRPDAGSRRLEVNGRQRRSRAPRPQGQLRVGVVGAGAFARSVLMPALAHRVDLAAVATATGPSALASASRFGAGLATTDAAEVIAASDLDAIVIATRHDTHADYAIAALEAGKHVFVEKPLALSETELRRVEVAAAGAPGVLMVGFNRRFSPLGVQLRDALSGRGPLVITYRVNAGRTPRSHWTHDPKVGGGRVVGEVCHFVDFATFVCEGGPIGATAVAVGGGSEPRDDNVCATVRLDDGSIAQIAYTAFGDSRLPKERVEVLGEAGAGVLDDFRELRLYRQGSEDVVRRKRDKGHAAELEAFVTACGTGEQPWPFAEMAAVTRATFEIRDGIGAGLPAPR